jgi:predicted acylesterase/phospholipase RssA
MPEQIPSGRQAQRALEQARKEPLDSPALGTAASDLVEPCLVRQPRPARPPAAAGTPVALAFSGGGFRARLALGVLRFVADAGLLLGRASSVLRAAQGRNRAV